MRVCIVGVADGDLLAVLEDLTGLRLVQAEQHAHQRTFARTVLAQKGVYLALAQLQGDIIVCLDTREFLGNVEHLDHKILCQSAHSPFVSNRHLYYSVYHYTVFLRFCTLLFDFLAGCTLISITFVQAARFFARQNDPLRQSLAAMTERVVPCSPCGLFKFYWM